MPARPGRMGDHKSSSSSGRRAVTGVRNGLHNAADSLNVLLRRGHRSSRPPRSPRGSGPDVVAGVVAVPGAERPELQRRAVHRQQRLRVRHRGHRTRVALRVRRKQKRTAERRAPRVKADRSGGDVSVVAGRAVVTAVDPRAARQLRNRAGLLD
ncbi:MAG TPA: hypothetical protein VNN25_13600 [Thermoanaerobaculia bacterium]|nr:hypothetical protein [Thermoanaerobaculia bacterium]